MIFGAHQLTDTTRLIVEAERDRTHIMLQSGGNAGIGRGSEKPIRVLTARITELHGPLPDFPMPRGLSHCDLHHGKHAVTRETIIRFVLPFCGFHELARQLERGLQTRSNVWRQVKAAEHKEALQIVADAGVEKSLRRPKGGDRLRHGIGFQWRQRGRAGDMKPRVQAIACQSPRVGAGSKPNRRRRNSISFRVEPSARAQSSAAFSQ